MDSIALISWWLRSSIPPHPYKQTFTAPSVFIRGRCHGPAAIRQLIDCPFEMDPALFSRDRMAWLDVTRADIWNYFIFGISFYTKEQMKHFKSLDAYKLFQEDGIREILHREINGLYLLRGKVTHSMRLNEPSVDVWIILSNDGSVEFAHCK